MLKYISSYISHSFALNARLNSENMAPIVPPYLPTSLSDINDNIPVCDIVAGNLRKRKKDKNEIQETFTDSSDEEEEAPRIVKKRVVKVISNGRGKSKKDPDSEKDENKEDSDSEKDNHPHYEVKKVNPVKKKRFTDRGTESEVSETVSGLSSYEKMIEVKRAERIALLKSMEIDQIKSEISEAVSGIKQRKRNTISRSYKIVHSPRSVEPIRRSRRLAHKEVDFSEAALEKLSVKNSFQVSQIDSVDTIPSECTFRDALKSASSYEEFSSDLSIQKSKPNQKFISYDKAVLKNMTLSEFNVCKVVPTRITAASWYHSKEDLIIAAGDKFGSLGLWKIKDSETTPHLFRVHSGNIPNMQFCTFDPAQLITASYDGTMRCGDLVKHTFNEIYVSDVARCTWFDFLNPTTFLVSHSNGEVAVVDRKTERKTGEKRHSCHDFTIKTVCVHPVNKNVFVTADNKKIIRLWDLRKLQKKPVIEINHHQRTINSAFFSPVTGNSILTTSLDDSLCIFDSSKLTDVTLKTKIKHNNFTGRWLSLFRATWLPNSDNLFAVGCMEEPQRVQIFDEDLNLYHNMIDDNLTTYTSLHRFHPFRSALAACNSSGKIFVFT